MPHFLHPAAIQATPARRALLCALAVAAGLAPAAAHAGRAQAGSGMGIYSSWDLDTATVTGTGWRDGVVVDTRSVSGDPASANIQVDDGATSAEVRLDGQGVLRSAAGPGLPVSGQRSVRADLAAGTLQLGASSGYAGYTVPPGAYVREAWVQGYPFAEVFENFDIRWDAARVEPVVVTLRMTISGSIDGNAGDNGRVNAVNAFLGLGNIDPRDPLSPLWSTETSVDGTVLTLTGSPVNSQCNAVLGICDSFVNLYAALDLRSRALAGGDVSWGSGAPFAASFSASLALDSSPGVSLLRTDNLGQPLPGWAWVNAAPVPEPGSWLLLLAGLVGLGAVAARAGQGRRAAPRG
jgi:hypothetical protein